MLLMPSLQLPLVLRTSAQASPQPAVLQGLVQLLSSDEVRTANLKPGAVLLRMNCSAEQQVAEELVQPARGSAASRCTLVYHTHSMIISSAARAP
jgi:hypothetical protein